VVKIEKKLLKMTFSPSWREDKLAEHHLTPAAAIILFSFYTHLDFYTLLPSLKVK